MRFDRLLPAALTFALGLAGANGAWAEAALADGATVSATDSAPIDDANGIGTNDMGGLEDQKRSPKEATITDKLGAKVPLDVALVDHNGENVRLQKYFDGEKAVLLVMGYYNCAMLCSLVLNGTIKALKDVSLTPGEEFEVVVVSIDERETTAVAKEKRKNYLKAWGRDGAENTFTFHTGTQSEIKRIADAVGFGYKYDEDIDQFAHGAGIFVLSGDGTLSRTLFGVQFRPGDLKFALIDAADGNVGTIVDRVVMSCFQYYSDNHKYGVYIFGVVRIGGLLTLLLLGTLLFMLWKRERMNRASMKGPAAL